MARSSTFLANTLYNRRRFLGGVGEAALIGIAATQSLSFLCPATAKAAEVGPLDDSSRANRAYQIRHKVALYHKNVRHSDHPTNGDEELYANRIACYTKALPHNQRGEVDQNAFNKLVHALTTGDPVDFEQIPLGGVVKLTDPQAALAYELMSSDSHELEILAPPPLASAEQGSEIIELYWQALTRDVPFEEYETDPAISLASSEMSQLSEFRGPRHEGKVTSTTIFRGGSPGALEGPYISQFFWRDIPYPSTPISQQIRTAPPGIDYLWSYGEWLAIQNGSSAGPAQSDPIRRFVRNGRDLAEYVHRDFSFQHFLNAGLILLSFGGVALDPNNPYRHSSNQSGFSTFGAPQVLDVLARVANAALNCAWYQKWSVHRRIRPEEFGGLLHNHLTGMARNPIHAQVLNSRAVAEAFNRYGTYLLPLAYPEGCPTHPSYPAGHATISGACVTALKAMFDESFVFPNAVIATTDGLLLTPYDSTELKVGGELDKLAYNVSLGRDTAGVHWRSDSIEGMKLGEAIAITVLSETAECFNESFPGFSLTKFDGTKVVI
jgi:hypothetical protein